MESCIRRGGGMRENRMEKNNHRYKLILGLVHNVEAGLPIQSFEFIGLGIYLHFLSLCRIKLSYTFHYN